MGLLDGVLGNASKVDPAKIQQDFSQILAPGEKVEHAYQLIRDYFVFTDKRFVLVDKQGLTGSKVEYHSIPYKSIALPYCIIPSSSSSPLVTIPNTPTKATVPSRSKPRLCSSKELAISNPAKSGN